MVEWIDTGSLRYVGSGERQLAHWSVKVGEIILHVHERVEFNGGVFFLTTTPPVFHLQMLNDKTLDREAAQAEALALVAEWLERAQGAVMEAMKP